MWKELNDSYFILSIKLRNELSSGELDNQAYNELYNEVFIESNIELHDQLNRELNRKIINYEKRIK